MRDRNPISKCWPAWCVAGIFLMGGVGCGGNGKLEVKGKVTFDNVPVEQGEISFISPDGAADGSVIQEGEFQLEAPPGPKRVEIRASRPVTNRNLDPEMGVAYEDYIPAKYNRESTLSAEVTESGQEIQFDLEP